MLETNEEYYLNAVWGLQILSSCVASVPTVAHAILGLEENSGLTIQQALFAKKLLDLIGTQDIFEMECPILQMRIASECLSVL